MTQTRLSLDLQKGLVDVEGDETFVRSVYEDFKELLSGYPEQRGAGDNESAGDNKVDSTAAAPAPKKSRSRNRSAKRAEGSDNSASQAAYKPEFLSNLDVSGLKEFFTGFAPKNHSEKILIFSRFLSDEKGIKPFGFNHIFTCYKSLREKMPTAFVQALRDTKSRHHFIEFNGPDSIAVTLHGDNHFDHELQKAGAKPE